MPLKNSILANILAGISSLILLQTLYFKFTGAEESVYIFSKIGMEPVGRYVIGVSELITGIILWFPRFRIWGAISALTIIIGAIYFHLTTLGIEVMNDGGQLFIMACIVFVCSVVLLYLEKYKLPIIEK